MVIEISDMTNVDNIKEVFNAEYPYLQIELYAIDGEPRKPVPSHVPIGSYRSMHKTGKMQIHSLHTVAEIENAFDQKLGIKAEILRKRDGFWVRPDEREYLTLRQQNEAGKIESRGYSSRAI